MADAIVSITIPEAYIPRVREALLNKFPKPAGWTDLAWVKEILRRYIKMIVLEYEELKAVEAANLEASQLIDEAKATVSVPENLTT